MHAIEPLTVTGGPDRRHRLRRWAAIAAFVYLTSTIVVMASERAYWYWAGIDLESILLIGVFYLIPTMAGLWALALAPARRTHQVVLAAAVFAIVVEGVLTPIIYLDGPLPVMAFMFMGWHGLVAFVGFWYLARRWLVGRRHRMAAIVSVGFGAFWGAWALSASVADPDEAVLAAGIETGRLDPTGFARYAFAVGATLAVAHWLIGLVWPEEWTPSRRSTRMVWFLAAAYMSVAVIPVVFWAPAKLALLVGGTWWLLRRGAPDGEGAGAAGAGEPTIIEQLAGRVRLRSVAPILLMPAAASLVYAAGWELAPSDGALTVVYGGLVGLQIVAGAAAYGWAARRARRTPAPGGIDQAVS
ncbi:MAG: hypothetical protein ACE5GB_08500 [Acidimicrobiales bacterium]